MPLLRLSACLVTIGAVVGVLPGGVGSRPNASFLASGGKTAFSRAAAPQAWSGTITWSETASADYTDMCAGSCSGITLHVHLERRESAVYTLTGQTAANGSVVAQMAGSSTSSLRIAENPPGCTITPFYDWSYQSAASVRLTYVQGQFVVDPAPVTAPTLTGLFNAGCTTTPQPPEQLYEKVPGVGELAPFTCSCITFNAPNNVPPFVFQEAASENATKLAGSTTVPWIYTDSAGSFTLGSVTMTWDLTAAAASVTPHGPPFSFGGIGPHGAYTVNIDINGSVHAAGNGGLTRVGSPLLAPTQLNALNRSATLAHFGGFRSLTRCAGALAASTTWIRIGSKKVTVTGTCLPAYQRLFKAFVAATHFHAST
jgi:hypothetical protein